MTTPSPTGPNERLDPALTEAGVSAVLGLGTPLGFALGPGAVVRLGSAGAMGVARASGEVLWRFGAACLAGAHAAKAPVLALATARHVLVVDTVELRVCHRWEREGARAPALALSDDGRFLAVAEREQPVLVRNLGTGEVLHALRDLSDVRSLQFRADGQWLAGGSDAGSFEVWDVARGADVTPLILSFKRLFNAHAHPVMELAFGENGLLATGDREGQVKVWDVDDGKLLAEFERPSRIGGGLAFCPDGRLAGGTSFGSIRLWDVSKATVDAELHTHGPWIVGVRVPGDAQELLALDLDGTLSVWNLARCEELGRWQLSSGASTAELVARARGATRYVLRENPRTIRVFDLPERAGPPFRTPGEPAGPTARFTVELPLEFEHAQLRPGHDQLLVTSAQGALTLWNLADSRRLFAFQGPREAILAAAFNRDGTLLAGADANGQVHVWNADSGKPQWSVRARAHGLARPVFLPDGRGLAVACQSEGVRRFQGEGAAERTLPCEGDVSLLAWSDDGTRFATASDDGVVRLWDAASGALRARYSSFGNALRTLAFSADGRSLLALAPEGAGLLWALSP